MLQNTGNHAPLHASKHRQPCPTVCFKTQATAPHCMLQNTGNHTGNRTPLHASKHRQPHPTVCLKTQATTPHCVLQNKGNRAPLRASKQRQPHCTRFKTQATMPPGHLKKGKKEKVWVPTVMPHRYVHSSLSSACLAFLTALAMASAAADGMPPPPPPPPPPEVLAAAADSAAALAASAASDPGEISSPSRC